MQTWRRLRRMLTSPQGAVRRSLKEQLVGVVSPVPAKHCAASHALVAVWLALNAERSVLAAAQLALVAAHWEHFVASPVLVAV